MRRTRSGVRLCVGGLPTTRYVLTVIGATSGTRQVKLVRYRPALHQNKQCVRLVCHGPVLRLSKTRVRPVCRRPVRQRIRHIQEVRRVTPGTIHETGMTIVTSGLTSGRMVTMATDGFMAGTSTTTAMSGRTLGESAILALYVNTMMTI